LSAVHHHAQREAGVDAFAVDQDRAGPALAVVAALLRPRELEVLAQRVEQRRPRRELQSDGRAVEVERDRVAFLGHDVLAQWAISAPAGDARAKPGTKAASRVRGGKACRIGTWTLI